MQKVISEKLGDDKTKKETIRWLKTEYMDKEKHSGSESKVRSVDFTMSMVFCVYRAINDKSRPLYGSDFGFSPHQRNGETLDGIVRKIFATCPGFYAPHPDKVDSLNFLMRQIIYAMFADIRTVLRDLG